MDFGEEWGCGEFCEEEGWEARSQGRLLRHDEVIFSGPDQRWFGVVDRAPVLS